jgi:hypothetical protein
LSEKWAVVNAMPGPPPSANPRRRNARPNTVQLPAAGYDGPVPDWPLSAPLKTERDTWEQLWRLPQAAAWEQLKVSRTVARYVRALVVAESRKATAFHLSEVRQLEDRLGLTPMAMLRLRWEVVADELADAKAAKREERPRLRAVE